jgi:DNA-binding response OmpR family regulator
LFEKVSPTVMVVEGDPHLSYLLQSYVKMSGYRPLTAGLGERALVLARQERPVLIVLGVELPRMTGWDVLQALKKDRVTRKIPVLICSWADERLRSLTEGAAGCLQRPVPYSDFLAALKAFTTYPPYHPTRHRCSRVAR